jgi:hypothetical protein
LENKEKCFDLSMKKLERIKMFNKKYEVLCNSLSDFKTNLALLKKFKYNYDGTQTLVLNTNSTICSSKGSINSKLTKFLNTLQSIKEIEPNLKFNKVTIYEYYRGISYFFIDRNPSEAMRILMNIVNSKKHFMPALFSLWKILKSTKEYKLLLNFSYLIVKISHLNESSYSSWIKSYILYSKALYLNKKYEESITLLRNMLDIFANVPIEEVKFLSEINKTNKISSTNFFVNFDTALSFYSKYNVYKKSEGIFHFNFTLKRRRMGNTMGFRNMNFEVLNSLNLCSPVTERRRESKIMEESPVKRDRFKSANYPEDNSIQLKQSTNTNSFLNNYQSMSPDINRKYRRSENDTNSIRDINISTKERLEEYLLQNIDLIEVPTESPCIILYLT